MCVLPYQMTHEFVTFQIKNNNDWHEIKLLIYKLN